MTILAYNPSIMEVRSEGIVLYVVPYGEEDEVAGIFTPLGLFSLVRKWKQRKAPLSPLSCCDFLWQEGKGDMVKVKEMHLLNAYLPLRERLETLEAAMGCLQAVRYTQGPEPAERLYQLLKSFLERMPRAKDPQTFLSAFYLKLLIYDGLLDLTKLNFEMAHLAAERSFTALSALELPKGFHNQVKKLFDELSSFGLR